MSQIEKLFKVEKEPVLFTFQLPGIEENEETVQISPTQIKRILGLVSVMVTNGCEYRQIALFHEEGNLSGIAFSLSGETDKLRKVLDEHFDTPGVEIENKDV